MAQTPALSSAGAEAASSRKLPFFRNEYTTTLTLLTATLCLVFPICSYAVFGLGADRVSTAGVLSIAFVVVMASLFAAPFLPFPSLRGETTYRRLERTVYIWILAHALTSLTWQIPWLLLHERIATAQNELWAYTWWAYIDGGDLRYVNPNWMVFFIEGWSDINSILSLIALRAWFKSEKTNPLPVYYFMFAAPLHIYPTILYYVSEIAEGLPNVDESSFVNLVVKFMLSNSFWVILPFFVLAWGKQTLERVYQAKYSGRAAA